MRFVGDCALATGHRIVAPIFNGEYKVEILKILQALTLDECSSSSKKSVVSMLLFIHLDIMLIFQNNVKHLQPKCTVTSNRS